MTTRRPRARATLAVLAAAALIGGLAACGSDDGGATTDSGDGSAGASAAEGGITIETADGPVTLDEPAEEVVALEWVFVEDLLALGVTPAGVADVDGYETWVDVGEDLPDGVADVGTRQEPSLERIRALQPDLILTTPDRSAANDEELEDIAPTLVLETLPLEDQWENMEKLVRDLGAATGRDDRAEQVLDDLETTVADAAEDLEAADLPTDRFLLTLPGTAGGQMGFRVSTDNALLVEALTRAGLENAWEAGPAEYGFTETNVEGLTPVDGDLLFLYSTVPEDDIVADGLPGNPLWDDLSFVRDGQVHDLGPGVWFYGGPLSIETLYTRVLDALG